MAWTIETYNGQRATGQPSAWRIAMFELCRAVNERQAAHGFAKTEWIKADGLEDSDIGMSDLYLLRMTGVANGFGVNCARLMAAIKALTPSFSETSGISAAWTVSNLETAVGLGTFIDEPVRAQQALFFQQCHDALDLLIHARRSLALHLGEFDYTVTDTYESIIADASAQNVWDSALGETPTQFVSYDRLIYEMLYDQFTTNEYYGCTIYSNSDSSRIFLDSLSGTITACQYSIDWSVPSIADKGGSMTVFIGSTTTSKSLTGSGPQLVNEVITGVHGDLTIGATNNLLFTNDLPATYPLESLSGASRARIECIPQALILYFDIAGELTDQA